MCVWVYKTTTVVLLWFLHACSLSTIHLELDVKLRETEHRGGTEREREREMAALTTSTPWLRNQSSSRTMKGNDGHAGVLDDARTRDRWWSYMWRNHWLFPSADGRTDVQRGVTPTGLMTPWDAGANKEDARRAATWRELTHCTRIIIVIIIIISCRYPATTGWLSIHRLVPASLGDSPGTAAATASSSEWHQASDVTWLRADCINVTQAWSEE